MFAPTLFIGAMVGAAVGTLQHRFFPGFTGPLGSYALVGMGTLFAGFLRVPMTSVFMVLEVSGNYSIILPVLISNTIAYLICRRFQPTPIFDLMTRQDGLDLPSMEEGREQIVAARGKRHAQTAGPDSEVFRHGRRRRFTYRGRHRRDTGGFACSCPTTLADGRSCASRRCRNCSRPDGVTLPLERCSPVRPHCPDYIPTSRSIWRCGCCATRRFLPVVHRADARRLIGILSLEDILAAYRRASVSELPHLPD